MSPPTHYSVLVEHYERCLAAHGDTPQGVDWPKADDAQLRYAVMLSMVDPARPSRLLDLGCGAAHLLDHLHERGSHPLLEYVGADLSTAFVALCRQKHPNTVFRQVDLLADHPPLGRFDHVVMNGVFTERRELSFDEMWAFFERLVLAAWQHTEHTLAFNVMSSHVDWERDDLFHVPFDRLTTFLCSSVSRHFQIRHDYGLYEYTVFVSRAPRS